MRRIRARFGHRTHAITTTSERIGQSVIGNCVGQVGLFGCTFAFLHLCGGIRHLVWDTVHGFELRSIYISGWTVVAASVVLTAAAWTISLFVAECYL